MANPAKNSAKDLLDENIFYKFELEHFKPTYICKEKNNFLRIFKSFKSAKNWVPKSTNHQNILETQIATPQSATFAESPQI